MSRALIELRVKPRTELLYPLNRQLSSYIIDKDIARAYGGLREKRFLLPFWEKRRFGAKTPLKYSKILTTSL